MSSARLFYGVGMPLLTSVSTLFYLRILFIFITMSKYRRLECYQIMIQIGVVQCLMCPGWFLLGLSRIVPIDSLMLFFMKLVVSSARTEILLSLVLALNRLKIMTGLRYPDCVHKILLALSWAFGACYLALFISPLAGYAISDTNYLTTFDMTYPWSYFLFRLGSFEMLSAIAATLIVHVLLLAAMIKQRHKTKITSAVSKEKSIFLFAFIKFACDGSLAVIYHFGSLFLPLDIWVGFVFGFAYVFNYLLLPPLCYLLLNRSLREDIFGVSNRIFVVEHHH